MKKKRRKKEKAKSRIDMNRLQTIANDTRE